MGLSIIGYKNLLKKLLPPGYAWSGLMTVLDGFAAELKRVDDSAERVILESIPAKADYMLDDWERITGVVTGGSLENRRRAIEAQLTAVGGQTAAYIIESAAQLGFVIGIQEFDVFKVGSAAGDMVASDPWAYVFRVIADSVPIDDFCVGSNSVGDTLRYWDNETLRRMIVARKPAHTYPLFSYASLRARAGITQAGEPTMRILD